MNAHPHSLELKTPLTSESEKTIMSDEALAFIDKLVSQFQAEQRSLLEKRQAKQQQYDNGLLPEFLSATQSIREDDSWSVAPIPEDLLDRRVEITGPTDPKMVINALNSDAKVFMACLEDATSPTWKNLVEGQLALKEANSGTLTFTAPDTEKHYQLTQTNTVLIARPRGLHLLEKHIEQAGKPVSASLVDFGLYAFHNYKIRQQNGTGLYYYIPKLESHEEARWWSSVFDFTESYFGCKTGTIRATVLIETLPAAFEMEEILYEMKNHIVGMNCGRWDYIFSYIKTLRAHSDRLLPDRQQVTMDKPFLNAYSRLLIKTCHKRGAIAMGGMSAFIPSKDAKTNQQVLEKVKQDKTLEASNGHDGTWVAHPGLIPTAMEAFNAFIPKDRTHQMQVLREEDPDITAADLLEPCEGERTETGMRANIRVAIQYLAAWLDGKGCVPIYGLMEDAATCEISRASIWQMIKHEAILDTGKKVTKELFRQYLSEEASQVKQEVGLSKWESGKFGLSVELLDQITTANEMAPFLTTPAYKHI